jgi:hypothetical protein
MLICVGVIGVLLVLAIPGVPAAVEFIGSTLRGASASTSADSEAAAADAEPATDCRSLYPDRLWSELTWTPEVLLSQGAAAPATTTSLVGALTPTVRFSCIWKTEDGRSIATTVAAVSGAAAAVAQAALSADGFACAVEGDLVHCERERDGVTEIHDLRGETWVASTLTGWVPDDYATLVAGRAFA